MGLVNGSRWLLGFSGPSGRHIGSKRRHPTNSVLLIFESFVIGSRWPLGFSGPSGRHPPSVHWIDSTSDLPLRISARTRRRAPSTGHPSVAYEQTRLVQWTFYRTGGFGKPTQPRTIKTPKVRDGYFFVVNGAYLELVLPTSKAQMLMVVQGAGAHSSQFPKNLGKCPLAMKPRRQIGCLRS